MEEMKTKPSGLLIYKPAGTAFNFPKTLAIEFGIDLLEALLVVYLLSQTVLATFGRRVLFVTLAGLLAAIATQPSLWNWYGFNGTYTLANIVMEIDRLFLRRPRHRSRHQKHPRDPKSVASLVLVPFECLRALSLSKRLVLVIVCQTL